MKSLLVVLIYVISFVTFFFILSLIGLIFTDYSTAIHSDGWKGVYALFFGPWLSFFPAREYWMYNQEYFERVF